MCMSLSHGGEHGERREDRQGRHGCGCRSSASAHFKGHEHGRLWRSASRTSAWAAAARAGKMEMHRKAASRACDYRQSASAAVPVRADLRARRHPIIDGQRQCRHRPRPAASAADRCLAPASVRRTAYEPDCDEIAAKVLNYEDGRVREGGGGRTPAASMFRCAVEISPDCDCHPENDAPMVPDVGMFASFDPVALDQACADASAMPPRRWPAACWMSICTMRISMITMIISAIRRRRASRQTRLEHAEKIGVGTRAYELIRI